MDKDVEALMYFLKESNEEIIRSDRFYIIVSKLLEAEKRHTDNIYKSLRLRYIWTFVFTMITLFVIGLAYYDALHGSWFFLGYSFLSIINVYGLKSDFKSINSLSTIRELSRCRQALLTQCLISIKNNDDIDKIKILLNALWTLIQDPITKKEGDKKCKS